MSVLSRLCCSGLIMGALAAPAHADVTQAQAEALQRQLHDWVVGVVGPGVDVPALPLQFLPEGDHYRVQFDLNALLTGTGVTIEGGPWTATAHPLEGGRWAIDNMVLPSPLKIINAAGAPELQGSMTMRASAQENHTIFDPALATTASSDGTMRGLTQTVISPASRQETKVERVVWHQTMQPKDGGRQTLTFESTLEGYSSTQPGKDAKAPGMLMAIDRVRVTGHADEADFARMGTALRSALALGKMAAAGDHKKGEKLKPAERDALQTLVRAISELVGGVDGDQTMEGLNIQGGMFSGRIAKLSLGGGFGAPKGEAELHLRLAVDGLESPDIPPGAFRDFVPRHFALSPRLSGVGKDDLMRLITTAIDNGGDDMPGLTADAMAMLAKSPLTFGIEDLALDIGIAKLTGSAEIEASTPANVTGEAELRMTGFDALLRKVSAAQETKLAAPVLIFLKGIAERDGSEMVWKLKYEDGKLDVNGTDMSSMIPSK